MLRDHGQFKKYHHSIEGYNGRLDALQAAILKVKLRVLEESNRQRRRAAEIYEPLLRPAEGIVTPTEPAWAVFHVYVIRAQRRDESQHYLTEKNIGTGLHYPIPLHLQQAYIHLGYRQGDLLISEETAREILSLP